MKGRNFICTVKEGPTNGRELAPGHHYKQDFCTSVGKHPFQYSSPYLFPLVPEPCNPSEEESACCALNKTNQVPNDICISNGPRCAEDSYYNGMSSQSRCIDKTWVIADDGAGVGVSLGACFIATLDELLLQRPMYHRRLVEHEHRLAAQKACTLPISTGSRPAQVTK